MAKPPIPEVEFPVQDKTYPYSAFITEVRKDVIKHCTDRTGIAHPVLPPEKKVPEFWIHIKLKTKDNSITLAIRLDNFYLVGFRTPSGVWWEFGKNGGTHLLHDNPRWLGFGGRYKDLIGGNGLETVPLGRNEMTAAVNYLATKMKTLAEEEEEQLQQLLAADAKSSLVKLVIMVCEAARFFTVSRKVDDAFKKQEEVNISEIEGKQVKKWNISEIEGEQVKKWDRISNAFFEWAVKPTAVIPDMKALEIKDKNMAEKIVALVKDQN